MSYTELVVFKKDGKAHDLAEIRNSHRGAAAIWDIMGDRYLGKYIPDWAKSNPTQFPHYSRMMDNVEMKKVWALFNDTNVSLTDRIVMGSTLDWVMVKRKDLPELIKAFREFEGETSLKEQADIIEKALEDENNIGIAWNQTSVSENRWTSYKHHNTSGKSFPYNLKKHKEHWFLFEDVTEKPETKKETVAQ